MHTCSMVERSVVQPVCWPAVLDADADEPPNQPPETDQACHPPMTCLDWRSSLPVPRPSDAVWSWSSHWRCGTSVQPLDDVDQWPSIAPSPRTHASQSPPCREPAPGSRFRWRPAVTVPRSRQAPRPRRRSSVTGACPRARWPVTRQRPLASYGRNYDWDGIDGRRVEWRAQRVKQGWLRRTYDTTSRPASRVDQETTRKHETPTSATVMTSCLRHPPHASPVCSSSRSFIHDKLHFTTVFPTPWRPCVLARLTVNS